MSEEFPKKGKAGVVVNEVSDFHVEVQEVDVPEPSESGVERFADVAPNDRFRAPRASSSPQLHRAVHVRCPLHDERLGIAEDVRVRCEIRWA